MEAPKDAIAKVKPDLYKAATTIEDALAYLTSASVRNFYATVINTLERVAAPGFKTMAVAAHRGRYILCYDPEFVARVCNEELLATLEHEVLHIILHHIPRYLRLRTTYAEMIEKALFELCSNTASDLADNVLLRDNYPKIADPAKPLGEWILPELFDPPLPAKLDYENYHRLLVKIFKERLQTEVSELYKYAKKALDQQQQQLQNALNNAYPPSPSQPPAEKKEGEGNEEGQEPQQGQGQPQPQSGQQPGDQGQPQPGGEGQNPGNGQGQGQGQPQQGQGQDQDGSFEINLSELDPIDQLAVKLLMNAMQKHMAWGAAADMNKKESQEGDPHKLEEHGRQIIRDASKNAQKTRGTVPSEVAELIAKMLLPPTVPWTQFLHNIVQQTRQTKKIRGMARPSKKLAAFKIFAHVSEKNDSEDRIDPTN